MRNATILFLMMVVPLARGLAQQIRDQVPPVIVVSGNAQIEADPMAQRTLDLPRLRALVDDWPTGEWDREDVRAPYRMALLRGVSLGHFLVRANGA